MSVLVVGLGHRSAPVPLLERAALASDAAAKVMRDLLRSGAIAEAVVLSTCNRVEVYADVEKFHAGVAAVSEQLARSSGVALDELTEHLYVHYEDAAVAHLFTVVCGLDSMVVGEAQILGQVRAAYDAARAEVATGRVCHELFQAALRVGKRARSETGIDRAGRTLVSAGLATGERPLGGLAGRRAVLVGAGSMGALAGATLRRFGVTDLTVVNRGLDRAARLAASLGGEAVALDGLAAAIAAADLVVSATGSPGIVIDAELVATTRREGRPLFVLDLALPHDVDPAVRGLPGVTLTDLESLRGVLEAADSAAEVDAVRRIVAEEVTGFVAWQRCAAVAPTVVALRAMAADLVETELGRLSARLPHLDDRSRAEVSTTVRRVVDKLLHAPTVRVKELAGAPGGDAYAAALRDLFGLDPAAPEAVSRPEAGP